MGIQVEFNPDLALRSFAEYQAGRRELPLLETKGEAQLSKPLASIIILEATHFLRDGAPYTKGKYKVIEVFNDDKIHFNSYAKVT